MKMLIRVFMLAGILCWMKTHACDNDGNGYIGSVCWTANNFCPRGTLAASGATVSINDYTSLFSVIGVRYGGNGTTNFKLPNLNQREAVGIGAGPGLSPVFLGQMLGATNSPAVLPEHTHQVNLGQVNWQLAVHSQDGDKKPATGNTWSSLDSTDYHLYADEIQSSPATLKPGIVNVSLQDAAGSPVTNLQTQSAGEGQPIPVTGSNLSVTACINVSGLYPPRN